MSTISVNGIDLFYEVQGRGEPLLLIAGFSCDSYYWSAVRRWLVKRYQVIWFDNRGIGRSSAPNNPYTISQMAADAAALLEYLEIDKVHIAGHSMGGQIAQELALAHSEKVLSLLLLSSWAKGDEMFHAIVKTFGDLPQTLKPQQYLQVILPWMFTAEFYANPEAVEQIIQFAVEYPFPPTANGLYHQSRAILGSNTSERLAEIDCPTMVLVGKQDILTPMKFAKQLVQGLPKAELVILESGGHGCVVESAEAVAQAMLTFLSKM
ncbi:MAG: alpha/beta hydrolase [Chroococcidiopsidaceae cyanobacterium CP_BM_ER_R8_30]|nr:alpha/beta hydrolase [Chroococcidiopsidaceae cyanobacterium CP_BM_ER_R8_30]